MELADLISEDVVTVYLDDSILDVADRLQTERVGSAVVLDARDEITGMITDRDLVVYGQNFADTLERTRVNDIMATDVFTVGPDVDVAELTERMREECVRRVPVVEDGEVLGIVTLDDLVVGLAGELDSPELSNLAAVIEAESPKRGGDPNAA